MLLFYYFFSSNFICGYNMSDYPFDIQMCLIEMTLDEKQMTSIRKEYKKLWNLNLQVIVYLFHNNKKTFKNRTGF